MYCPVVTRVAFAHRDQPRGACARRQRRADRTAPTLSSVAAQHAGETWTGSGMQCLVLSNADGWGESLHLGAARRMLSQ
eukprot:1524782-Rhodomonas_salina.1